MKKKVLAFAVASAMCASLFAGCGSSSSSSTAASTAASSTKAESTTAASSTAASSTAASSSEEVYIAMLGKAVNNDTWQTFFAGAKAACAEVTAAGANVKLECDGASDSTKREDQLNLIENYIGKGIDGLCFATDAEGATDIVDKAHDDGLNVVLVDTPIEGYTTYDAQITYDNVTAGEMAAEALIEAMDAAGVDYSGEGAMVIVQDPVSGVSTLDSRAEGITSVFADKAPNVTVEVMYCNGDNAQALANAQDAYNKYGDKIVGMIGLDEGVTCAISSCVRENGLEGKFPVTGIDATSTSVEEVQSGNVYAVVGMSMYNLGYEGFMAIYNQCIGQAGEKEVELAPILVTADNCMDDGIRETWDNSILLADN